MILTKPTILNQLLNQTSKPGTFEDKSANADNAPAYGLNRVCCHGAVVQGSRL